jgi:hypothetical protein
MIEFFELFKPYEVAIVGYAIIWGIAFGIKNTWVRFQACIRGRRMIQSDAGKLGDGVWYFCLLAIASFQFLPL